MMKLYRPFHHRLMKHLQPLKKLYSKQKMSLQYMDVKELSERMEQARTAAQFAVLRYKYNGLKTRRNREDLRQAIDLYMESKQRYYDSARAYLAQCQQPSSWHRPAANDDHLFNQKSNS